MQAKKHFDRLCSESYLWDRVSEKVQALCELAGTLAAEMGIRVFVVGGFVRDLLLGRTNRNLDLVVEGNALDFARALNEYCRGKLKVFPTFGTAKLSLCGWGEIDFATTRTEFYPFPGALPQITQSSINEDLSRRDFTVNTIALPLKEKGFGKMLDFFGGCQDLNQGILRVLHPLSFVEDPTRLFRGLRLIVRYGFTWEERTGRLALDAIAGKSLDYLSSERLRDELIMTLNEVNVAEAVALMQEWGMWQQVFPGNVLDARQLDALGKAETSFERLFSTHFPENVDKWLVYLIILLYKLTREEIEEACQRLRFSKTIRDKLVRTQEHWKNVQSLLLTTKAPLPSFIFNQLELLPKEGLVALLVLTPYPEIKKHLEWFLQLPPPAFTINGDDLISFGYRPGPQFKELLQAIKDAQLDGVITRKEQAADFIQNYLKHGKERKV